MASLLNLKNKKMIPKITINLQTGGLGFIGGTDDGVCGLVIGCAVGSSGIVTGDKFVLNSIDDAITAKINLIPYAYQQVKEFYAEAGTGSKLYVLICGDTETLSDMADAASTNHYAKVLIDYSQGTIKMIGLCRKPASGYTPTVTNGIDADSFAAGVKLQALALTYFALFTPFVGFVEGRAFTEDPEDLTDLTLGSQNYVAYSIATSDELKAIDATASSLGLAMGRAAKIPVQRKIARVKDGGLSVTGVYYGTKTLENTDFASIATKGYLTIGTFANKTGYYFQDDTLATVQTDDYKTISNRRVINKIVRLVYQTYINELNDDIELTAAGKLSPATAKYYQGIIENAVNLSMTSASELSNFSAYVDLNQNVLSTGKIIVKCSAIPKGYSQEIIVNLGFSNPVLSA